ncbi:hypothetical protein AQUCO_01500088v1 [Aquilegia coerulea]|uniref:Uncharacterized protein n=1 Tax=Aquilegia coerulea TaxID=218851 RepID=A0A2G5DS31_AQUCA|nr:hypothetical protein AQUCO_01500088v1 [Aquilegia coerulea]
MGRKISCTTGLKKGTWTEEEDTLLKRCIEKYGEGNWHKVPLRAGLNRCRKSCRLRWINYLNPNIKREELSWDEIDLIIKMHKLLGNRWSLIAARLPGRTANDIKNRWNTHIFKSLQKQQSETITPNKIKVIKPQPWTFPKKFQDIKSTHNSTEKKATQCGEQLHEKSLLEFENEQSIKWLENFLLDKKDEFAIDSSSFDDIVPDIDMSVLLDLNLWESLE